MDLFFWRRLMKNANIIKGKERVRRRQIHWSIDLNEPAFDPSASELADPSEFPLSFENKLVTEFQPEPSRKAEEKRIPGESGQRQNKSLANLDSSLRISPPAPSPSDLLVTGTKVVPLTTNLRAALGLDGGEFSELGIPKLPKMILKGCQHCHMFAMVSEIKLKCPNCGGRDLIGDFSGGKAKRVKKN